MSRLIGYTRELFAGDSVADDIQLLNDAGAVRVFEDAGSVDLRGRVGLAACLQSLTAGETLVVSSAARLAQSVTHFVTTVSDLAGREVAFRSLSEPGLSTGTDPVDPAVMFVALEGLRKRLAGMQTRAGMAAAAREGRRPGRPTVMTPERIAMAVELRNVGRPITHVARVLGVSPNAVYRALATLPEAPEPTRRRRTAEQGSGVGIS
jgi:DNA invertase Pin-like site-specific DNA recombinase